MNTRSLFNLFLYLLIIISFNSCGAVQTLNLNATGHIDTTQIDVFSGPTFLIITKTDNFDLIEQDPVENVVTVITINQSGNFEIDFAQFGIEVGDIIYLIAFVDNDYDKNIPYPTVGDYVGFYIDPNTLDTAYTVKNENNINIIINREIFDFNASVEGKINGTEQGDVILIAYSGEITSMDFTSINVDDIIGYKKILKQDTPFEYNLSILPYGKDVPIEEVFIIAYLDVNKNGVPDSGDKLGYHKNAVNYPEPIIVTEGQQSNIDIDFTMDLAIPSGFNLDLSGNFTVPNGYDSSSPPIFIIAAATSNPQDLINNPFEVIKNFQKIPPGENKFNINLSNTDLTPGEEIMVIGLWDKDFDSGFPEISEGDVVGFYINSSTFEFSVPLVEGTNNIIPEGSWTFDIDKIFHNFSATVQGTIQDEEVGDLVVLGYTGDLSSLDLSAININDIAGFEKISKPVGFYDYTVNIFPFGKNVPIENVQLIAFLDKNGNGLPDEGDRAGFHRNIVDHMPQVITVQNGNNTGVDLEITKRIYDFSTSVNFKLNPNNHPGDLDPGDDLLSVVVHTDGINGKTIDADYVLGMKNIPYQGDQNYIYSFDLYNFIDEDLGELHSGGTLPTNVLTIFDRNGNGRPDSGEDIAAYWGSIIFVGYFPKEYQLILDTSNTLSNPDNVRFITQKVD